MNQKSTEFIVVALAILGLNTVCYFTQTLTEYDFGTRNTIEFGGYILIRLMAATYANRRAKELQFNRAFWTVIVLILPFIGLLFMAFQSEVEKEKNIENNESEDSVNDELVLKELIEKINAKK